jgi:hypothetical protein
VNQVVARAGVAKGALPVWYSPDGPKAPEQLAGELADLVLAGLGSGPASEHRRDEVPRSGASTR